MKIAIDYTTGIYPGAGVARYTRSLVGALAELDRESEYSLFYAARGLPRPTPETEQADKLLAQHPNIRPVAIPFSVRQMFAVWQRLRLPLPVDLFTGRCDVVHSPDFVSPPHRSGADIITVHDMSFMVVPEHAEPKLASFLGKTVPAAVRRADRVIAVSEQTKRDVTRLLGVREEKVTVAFNGVDARFRPLGEAADGEIESLRKKLGLPERFILHVGTLEPRKNLKRLVEAYGLLVSKGQAGKPAALVLAGRKGWLFDPILAAAERANREGGRVIFLDYVYDNHLPLLYNMADVFAYPSLYEGFGLPVAEALACGVPTVVSQDGALSEVVGEAAVRVDAQSVESIANGLEQALNDDKLRARLRREGPAQVAHFTWKAAARIVLDIYTGFGRI
jgi:glycosyltransferase involved in cell wall biosynthesis